MRRSLDEIPTGNRCWIPGYGMYVVLGVGYYLSVLAALDSEDRPIFGSICSVADCTLAYDKGPCAAVDANREGDFGLGFDLPGLWSRDET